MLIHVGYPHQGTYWKNSKNKNLDGVGWMGID
jgi:hypothetical protein